MDKLKAMAAFVCMAEHSSLTRAARQLRTSLPTVVRTLAALEAELGLRLVNRTTRRLAITEEGNQYAAHCRAVLAAIAEGEQRLSDRKFVARGRVVATAPGPFGRRFVVPAVTEFLAEQPRVSVELLLLDRVVNLLEEGVDLAVRVGHLPDSSLVAVRVGTTRHVICASPSYLAEHGRPKRPNDLASHACLRLIGSGSWHDWVLRHGKRTRRVSVAGRFDSNQREAQLLACEQGLGLAQFLDYQVADALREGRLERVLEPYEPAPLPIHVVYPHARHASARVRALSSFLVERLRATHNASNPA
jgi:DNA-binding transcriptional LysR family regulator